MPDLSAGNQSVFGGGGGGGGGDPPDDRPVKLPHR